MAMRRGAPALVRAGAPVAPLTAGSRAQYFQSSGPGGLSANLNALERAAAGSSLSPSIAPSHARVLPSATIPTSILDGLMVSASSIDAVRTIDRVHEQLRSDHCVPPANDRKRLPVDRWTNC